jgi:hypothetical protein
MVVFRVEYSIRKGIVLDLKASLDTVRQINWLDGIHQLTDDVDESLCSISREKFKGFRYEFRFIGSMFGYNSGIS